MNEELIRKYQETISLLQYRNPKNSYHGEFVNDSDDKTAFRLTFYKTFDDSSSWSSTTFSSKTFKYMNTREEALKYFIKAAQNRVF